MKVVKPAWHRVMSREGLRTRHTINMIRQSQFIALETHVYIVPCHAIALMWLDACTVHALFTRTSQSLIHVMLSVGRIKLLLKILFFLLIAVNAGLIVTLMPAPLPAIRGQAQCIWRAHHMAVVSPTELCNFCWLSSCVLYRGTMLTFFSLFKPKLLVFSMCRQLA